MENSLILNDYNLLKDEIIRLVQEGKARARAAVEQETLRTYHGIGGALHAHVLAHRERADYGAQVMARLAEDVGLSQALLYQMLGFYRMNPIFYTCRKLTWSHYRTLLSAPSAEAQRYYEAEAARAGVRAKAFVSEALGGLPLVAVTTTRPDKYDRYLADVFYLRGAEDAEVVLREGTFLNRALLAAGVAGRFGEGG